MTEPTRSRGGVGEAEALACTADAVNKILGYLQDPVAVRANILHGSIKIPEDLVWLHDSAGPVAGIRAERDAALARAEKAEAGEAERSQELRCHRAELSKARRQRDEAQANFGASLAAGARFETRVRELEEGLRESVGGLYSVIEALKWARVDLIGAKAVDRAVKNADAQIDAAHAAYDKAAALLAPKRDGG